MNTYTDEEIKNLLDSLEWGNNNWPYDDYDEAFTYIQVAPQPPGEPADIRQKMLLIEILRLFTDIKAPFHDRHLQQFLLTVPLDDVPLYINTYPELANWRLRIGK